MIDRALFWEQRCWRPKYWITWFGVGLMACLIRLPYRVQMAIGRFFGRVAYYVVWKERHFASVNVRLCFPDLPCREQKRLVKRSFESVGMGLFETALAGWGSDKQIESLIHSIEGLEHIEAALKEGKGVLLFISHFATLHIAGRMLARDVPFTAMYKGHKNRFYNQIMASGLSKHCEKLVHRSSVKDLIRALKQNKVVWYAPDLNVREDQGIFVPFFGNPACTVTVTARMSKATGAKVIPFNFHRREDGRGYDLKVHPILEEYPTGDVYEDTARIAHIQEAFVRAQPEQYFWLYKRFKTRPRGEEDVYLPY